ncbi:MAG TPA: hypothetical protein VH637_10175 [Streptosporangiaceae bacterium]|jgi:hypothetical protein
MNVDAQSATRPASTAAAPRLNRVRRGSLAVFVLVVAEFGLGMYVNLYVSGPAAGHGASLGSVISGGPAALSAHAVTGLLLGLGAIGVLAASVAARRPACTAMAALGLIALAAADAAGTSFASSGHAEDSMAMSVCTGVALLCYAAISVAARPPGQRD